MKLEPKDAEDLKDKLAEYDGLEHLRVKKYGDSLILYSGDPKAPQHHAKMTCLGKNSWGLSLPMHTGRWEHTPFSAPFNDLLKTLISDFHCYLEKI